jgi:alpha-amylase
MSINQHDIIYFVLTDRFYGVPNPGVTDIQPQNPRGYHGGNIQGLIEKIPYFRELGVTAIWITPVYLQIQPLKGPSDADFSTAYHGYWPLDFNRMDPHFCVFDGRYPDGSKRYLRELSDALHNAGMKLILDMVVNHTGYGHPGTSDAPENPTPIKPYWYNRRGLSCSENMIEGELAALPDMDLDHPDVADYHIETILDWVRESGIDAIRMDTVKHVERAFWNYYKTQIKGCYPDITLIGEVLEFDVDAVSQYQQHWAFDCLFDFPLQQAMVDTFVFDQSLKRFVAPFNGGYGILEKDNFYTNHNKMVTLLDNHDLSCRYMTFAVDRTSGDPSKRSAARLMNLALSFMFTVRGIPQIYYGTEIGMEGRYDPENRRDFEWNRFDEKYHVRPEFAYAADIFYHTKKLIALRKENDALTCGNMITLFVDDFILAYLRYFDKNAVITVIHNGNLPMPSTLSIPLCGNAFIPERIQKLLKTCELACIITGKRTHLENGVLNVQLEAKSANIFVNS